MDVNQHYPAALKGAEDDLRRTRRGLKEASDQLPPAVGVGLSGGGIRSATFCLGFFQAASRLGQLRAIDYLSTVSGGGYFGAFLGRLFMRDFAKDPARVGAVLNGERWHADPSVGNSSVLNWLRENGRYLSPRGAGDVLQMLAGVLRNWVALQVTLSSVLLLAAFAVVLTRSAVEHIVLEGIGAWLVRSHCVSVTWGLWISPLWVFAAAILAFLAVPAGWAYWLLEWPSAEAISKRTVVVTGYMVFMLGPALALALVAYWLTNRTDAIRDLFGDRVNWAFFVFLVIASLAALLARLGSIVEEESATASRWRPSPRQIPPAIVVGVTVVVLGWLALIGAMSAAIVGAFVLAALIVVWLHSRRWLLREAQPQVYLDALARNRLTSLLRLFLTWTALILAATLADSLGESLYRASSLGGGGGNEGRFGFLVAALAALAAPAGKVLPVLLGPRRKRRGGSMMNPILAIVAGFVVTVLASSAFFLAHAVQWEFHAAPGRPESAAEARRLVAAMTVEEHEVRVAVQPAETRSPPAEPAEAEQPVGARLLPLVISTGGLLLLALLFGATWSFLNNSSQLPFYKARLARAYLGASNPARRTATSGRGARSKRGGDDVGISDVVIGDDIDLLEYFGLRAYWRGEKLSGAPAPPPPFERGGPLHLINVTINETKGGQSQVQQQDRKGLALCLGPAGLSAGVNDHVVFDVLDRAPATAGEGLPTIGDAGPWVAVTDRDDRAAEGSRFLVERVGSKSWLTLEPLTLGHWIAISGAAFSTGTGYRTSLGLSLLAGIGNVRLGYWWDSRRSALWPGNLLGRIPRRVFAVQAYLLQEFLARFPGTSRRHWYLSDGGHFENLGGYELIRRRSPLIVLVDAEADPEFEFGGLANLVRKARIDFGAEVHFLDHEELASVFEGKIPEPIGTLDQLKRGRWETDLSPGADGKVQRRALLDADRSRYSRAHAALAVVTYPDCEEWSLLLYVKASMTGDEPIDLLQYHREHESFPHESTSDQFFDEAQWESYRKLGEHIAQALFEVPERPWNLEGFTTPKKPCWDEIRKGRNQRKTDAMEEAT